MTSAGSPPALTDVPVPPSFAAEGARVLVLAMVVGILGGAAGLGFRGLADRLPELVWGPGADLVERVQAVPWWWRILVPAFGGLLAGVVLHAASRIVRQDRGWDLLEAVVLRDGVLHAGPTATRALSSLATVASGGAVGREGPIILLAATVASLLGRGLGVSTRQLRILTGCGVAAGMAAAYNTPVGAALFTMEVIFGSFALEVFSPLVIASVVATVLARSVYGNDPVFDVPSLELAQPLELLACAALGLAAGGVAAVFLQWLRSSAAFFRRHDRVPRPVAMAGVGLLLGVALIWFPDLVGNGREGIEHLFEVRMAAGYALGLLALRLLLTPLTVGSGAVGGVFTPTLFIGAMLGHALAVLAMPGAEPRAFALVGMGALLAGTTHAPLMSVLMVFEMTLDYHIVVPLLLACAVSTLTATAFSRESIYTEALRRKSGHLQPRLVRLLTVRDVMRQEQETVAADLPLAKLLERLVASRRNHVYVVEPSGRFLGAVSLHDANQALVQGGPESKVRSGDLLRRSFEATFPEEPLDRVLDRFARQPTERLPVLDDADARRLVGTVSRRDILGVLSLDLMQRPAHVVDLAAAQDEEVHEIDVPPDCLGRTVHDCDLAGRYEIALLTVRRNGRWMLPEPDTALEPGDRLLVTGRVETLARLTSSNVPDNG